MVKFDHCIIWCRLKLEIIILFLRKWPHAIWTIRLYKNYSTIVTVFSKVLKHHMKPKRRAPAYLRALRQIRGVVKRIVRGRAFAVKNRSRYALLSEKVKNYFPLKYIFASFKFTSLKNVGDLLLLLFHSISWFISLFIATLFTFLVLLNKSVQLYSE